MAQKANILTLRDQHKNLNLSISNTKTFVPLFNFLECLRTLFLRKGVWVVGEILNLKGNSCHLTLNLFYRAYKIISYKRKHYLKKSKKNVLSSAYYGAKLLSHLSLFRINSTFFRVKSTNRLVMTKNVFSLYMKLRRFSRTLFSRRFNLLVDFLKMTNLFSQNLVGTKAYLAVLGEVFRALSKRAHNKFLAFIKFLFALLIKDYKTFKGFKFVINGKLQGKTRSSSRFIQTGSVPFQTISEEVNFHCIHIYTLLGAFGLRLWATSRTLK